MMNTGIKKLAGIAVNIVLNRLQLSSNYEIKGYPEITIIDKSNPEERWVVISISENSDQKQLNISFSGWSDLILIIIEQLSRCCGALFVMPSSGGVPVCVTQGVDIDQLNNKWN